MAESPDVGSTVHRSIFKIKELDLSKLRNSQPLQKLDRQAMDQCQSCRSVGGGKGPLDKNMIMLSCGDILCVRCVDTHLKDSVLKEGEGTDIWCPVCLETTHVPEKLKLKVQEMKQKARQLGFSIFCDVHPDQEARYYCPTHRHLTCEACAHTDYSHLGEISELATSDIEDYCSRAIVRLLKFSD